MTVACHAMLAIVVKLDHCVQMEPRLYSGKCFDSLTPESLSSCGSSAMISELA